MAYGPVNGPGAKGDKGDTGAQGIQGTQGPKGDTGATGPQGKSAYQQAVEGGYTGTEAQFNNILATVNPSSYAPKASPEFTGSISLSRRSATTIGQGSFACGGVVEASGVYSHAEGLSTAASGKYSHAEGGSCTASGNYSHAEGRDTTASGESSHAEGEGCLASAIHQHVSGCYNVEYGNASNPFIIGKGSDSARANCFRVNFTGVYATGNYSSTGADYAELFEWFDGNPNNEDRCGRFVTLDGEKIRLAGPEDDFILGIISGNPSVLGNVHDDQWQGMFLYDIFGRPLWEDVEVPDEIEEMLDPENPEQTISRVAIPAHTEYRQKLNPAYDGTQPYLPRTQRPEWGTVGMMGKLVVIDDGSCEVNGWCTAGEDGVATRSDSRTRYRVMSRLDENHIRVLILHE